MVAAPESDYYLLLGVPESATTEEIRTAYRRAARECHPDVNPGDASAAGRFVLVQQAYEVLSDPDRRAAYRRPALGTAYGRPSRPATQPDDGSILPRDLQETLIAVRVIARMARPRVERRFRQLIRYLERL
jgi:curved DNA-binding protein CbpA